MSFREPSLSAASKTVSVSVFAALQARIDTYQEAGGELIPLQIGDTFLGPSPAVLAAASEPTGLSVYGAISGLPELRHVLAERLVESGHATVRGPSEVHVGVGCTHALFCAARAVLDAGDDVLVVTPHWPLITGVFQMVGAVPVEVPLTQGLFEAPRIDIARALERAVTPRTRGIYFSTPSNPDGYVFSAADLEAVAAVAVAHNLWVFSDEVYADFVYDGRHEPFANVPGMAGRTITGHSLSKSHALAGARIGYVTAPEHVIDATRRVSNHTVYNVPVGMQRLAHCAILTGGAFLEAARSTYRDARDKTVQALLQRGIPHRVPRGGSFVFVELASRLGGHSVQRLLEVAVDRGVLLAPGLAFGKAHGTSARLCFTGVPVRDVLLGIERLAQALDALSLEDPS